MWRTYVRRDVVVFSDIQQSEVKKVVLGVLVFPVLHVVVGDQMVKQVNEIKKKALFTPGARQLLVSCM